VFSLLVNFLTKIKEAGRCNPFMDCPLPTQQGVAHTILLCFFLTGK